MSVYFIEGTWEEIEHRKAELVGRHLRVTILPDGRESVPRPQLAPRPRQLAGFGAFKGKIGNSEEFAREKKAEIEREESAS